MAALLVLLAQPVRAQQAASDEREASSPDYARLVYDALQEYELGHWAEAHALFGRAHEMSPNARTLRALGSTDFELRHYVAALRELRAALEDTRNPLSDAQRAEAKLLIERAQAFIGKVCVDVTPTSAALLLDGAPVEGPELVLDAGDYTLVARAGGYQDAEARLRVQGGTTRTISLHLAQADLGVRTLPEPSAPIADGAQRAEPDRSGRVFGSWWFWTIAGVLVAGSITAVLIATHDPGEPKPEQGSVGLVQVLEVRR